MFLKKIKKFDGTRSICLGFLFSHIRNLILSVYLIYLNWVVFVILLNMQDLWG